MPTRFLTTAAFFAVFQGALLVVPAPARAELQEFEATEIIPSICIDGAVGAGGLSERCATADSTYSEPLPGYAGGPSEDPDPIDPPEDQAPPAPVCTTVTKSKVVTIGNGVGGCAYGGKQTTAYKETTCDGIVTATNITPVVTTSCTPAVCTTVTKSTTKTLANGAAGCLTGGTQTTTYKETSCNGVVTQTGVSPKTVNACNAVVLGCVVALAPTTQGGMQVQWIKTEVNLKTRIYGVVTDGAYTAGHPKIKDLNTCMSLILKYNPF